MRRPLQRSDDGAGERARWDDDDEDGLDGERDDGGADRCVADGHAVCAVDAVVADVDVVVVVVVVRRVAAELEWWAAVTDDSRLGRHDASVGPSFSAAECPTADTTSRDDDAA